MNENPPSCKPFPEPPQRPKLYDPARLPTPLASLLAGKQLYAHLSATDLREMAKFTELPNLAGLAAHTVARPAPADRAYFDLPTPSALSAACYKALDSGTGEDPTLVIRGRVIADCGLQIADLEMQDADAEWAQSGARKDLVLPGFEVIYLVPQTHAHLAQAMKMILRPAAEPDEGPAAQECAFPSAPACTLLHWPEPLRDKRGNILTESLVAHWPALGLGIIIGHDDPRLPLNLLLHVARRHWAELTPPPRYVAPGEGFFYVEESAHFTPLAPTATPAELAAAQEPFLILHDPSGAPALAAPVWANPLLPAGLLARDPAWRAAALAVGALPLGVAVDDKGRFPLLHEGAAVMPEAADMEAAGGWVVIPRSAVPSPFLNEARIFPLAPLR